MANRSTHRTIKFLACTLFLAVLATLLFIDPSFAQEAPSTAASGR